MKIRMLFSLMVLLAVFSTHVPAGTPVIPPTPAAVDGILLVQPFALDKPYQHLWQANGPMVSSGLILVLEVNPDLVLPRQTAEPVLYVGHQVAERVNSGYPSGKVVAIVPGDVDLSAAPIWFGDPALPEQVTPATITSQRGKAEAEGIKPLAAVRTDGNRLQLADQDALRRRAAELISQYAAGEEDLATGIQAPRVPE